MRFFSTLIATFLILRAPDLLFALQEADDSLDQAIGLGIESSLWPLILRMGILLTAIAFFLWIAARLVRKSLERGCSTSERSQRIEVLERHCLAHQTYLYLLRVDQQEILAAHTREGIQSLAHWTHSSNRSPS